MNIPPPPPGFQIEAAPAPRPAPASAGSVPPPPPGFQLEQGDGLNPSDPVMRSLSRKSQFANYDPSKRQRYQAALERVRQSQFPDMSDEEWANYSQQFFAPDIKAQADQSQAFGFSDELSAAVGGLGSQVRQWIGGGGPGYGESYGDLYELEQARLELARQQNGALGTAAEIVSGAAMLGPGRTAAGGLPALNVGPSMPAAVQSGGRLVQAAKAAVPLAAEGGIYGFGATDGDLGERAKGAATGAATSVAAGAAAPLVAKVAQGVGRRIAQVPVNMANRQAMRQAVKTSPTAAAIKGSSQAAYRAAEATGATITAKAMQDLPQSLGNTLRLAGIAGPNGQLAPEAAAAFPKLAHALGIVRQYSTRAVSIEEAQSILRALRGAQKSIDPNEARIGNLLVDRFEDFMDSLPVAAFGNRNVVNAGLAAKAGKSPGSEAIQQWAKGRTEWARAKRTQAIENIIADARLAKGGFASGLRSGFASMLKSNNAKKRRGFSKADLDAIERFVEGGPIQDLLERIGGGAGLPGGVLGGITGGPIGAVAVPTAGFGARRLTNSNARQAAQNLRAQVAIPGGVPMRSLPPPVPLPMPQGLRRIGGITGTRTND